MKPLKFEYTKTDFTYIRFYQDGKWEEGALKKEDTLTLSLMSTALHYGQEAFEGLKAYMTKDGKINLFRADENAKRFKRSCGFLKMPEIDVDDFVEAVKMTVKANQSFIPPYGSKGSLYIRPFMFGVGDNLGLKPSNAYVFAIIVTPVGPYFESGLKPVKLMVSAYDRAAPFGTGAYKVGGNYAASLFAQSIAKQKGFADCIFLDPKTHTKIEEVGAANFFGITKDLCYITPQSPSILKSITNMSLQYIAKNMLNMKVKLADVYIHELDHLIEAGACGTAAIITPIKSILHHDYLHVFPTKDDTGVYTQKLYDILTSIQVGDLEDPDGWIINV